MKLSIDTLGGNCPVQAEGLISGFAFYFRARGSHWSFTVYDGSDSGWCYAEDYPRGEFAAGWMDESEAKEFIAKAAQKFVEAREVAQREDPA